ncbi:hypothetical protein F4802DRAFT_586879 [Xylaria palmicola]|nr:hypothetical protein F4802DRAFT_586879 [Xylaria palmicola]
MSAFRQSSTSCFKTVSGDGALAHSQTVTPGSQPSADSEVSSVDSVDDDPDTGSRDPRIPNSTSASVSSSDTVSEDVTIAGDPRTGQSPTAPSSIVPSLSSYATSATSSSAAPSLSPSPSSYPYLPVDPYPGSPSPSATPSPDPMPLGHLPQPVSSIYSTSPQHGNEGGRPYPANAYPVHRVGAIGT